MSLDKKIVINEKYAPCNNRKFSSIYCASCKLDAPKLEIIKKDNGYQIDTIFDFTFFVEDINDNLDFSKYELFHMNDKHNIGHYLAGHYILSKDLLDKLFTLGYNIFQENYHGYSLAHNITIHCYYYEWLSKTYNISFETINKEFEEYGNENAICRVSKLISQ